jgi:hypothetical protein
MQSDEAFYRHLRSLIEERERRIAALRALASPVKVRLVRRIPNFLGLPQVYFQVGRSRLRRPTPAQLRAHGLAATNALSHAIARVAAVDALVERMLHDAAQMERAAIELMARIDRVIRTTTHPPEARDLEALAQLLLAAAPPEDIPMPFAARAKALAAFDRVFACLSTSVDRFWGRHLRKERGYYQRFVLVLQNARARQSPVRPRWMAFVRHPRGNKWVFRTSISGQRHKILQIPTPLTREVLGRLGLKQHVRFYMHVSSLAKRMVQLRRDGRALWAFARCTWTLVDRADRARKRGYPQVASDRPPITPVLDAASLQTATPQRDPQIGKNSGKGAND